MSLNTLLKARLTKLESLIVVYEDAIQALGEGNVQRYQLDTGQTNQVVTKLDLPELNKMYDSLLNKYAVIDARLSGSGVVRVCPGW